MTQWHPRCTVCEASIPLHCYGATGWLLLLVGLLPVGCCWLATVGVLLVRCCCLAAVGWLLLVGCCWLLAAVLLLPPPLLLLLAYCCWCCCLSLPLPLLRHGLIYSFAVCHCHAHPMIIAVFHCRLFVGNVFQAWQACLVKRVPHAEISNARTLP